MTNEQNLTLKNIKNTKKKLLFIYERLFTHFGPQCWWPGKTPFEVAVGAILTQNTNWQNVERAIDNLKGARALSAEAIRRMPEEELAELIRPSGYFRQKAVRLKIFVDFLYKHYRGGIAAMKKEELVLLREKLLSVKGIGPETADSIILYAVEKPVFVVDAYTKRVLIRHGFIEQKASYYEIQNLFHENLHFQADSKMYNEYHALFVRLCKEFCRKKASCNGCPLLNQFNAKPELA